MKTLITSWRHHLVASNKSPRTVSDYETSMLRFAQWAESQPEPLTVEIIRKTHVRAWPAHELGRVSAKTTNRHYQAVRQFFIWAHAEEEISTNPCVGVKQPQVPAKLIEVPTTGHIKDLLRATGADLIGLRDRAIIMVLMDAGLRASELIGLALDDVDLDNGIVLVLGKSRRKRQVPIGKKTISALDRYLRARAKSDDAHRPELWLSKKGILTDSGLRQLTARRQGCTPRPIAPGFQRSSSATSPRPPTGAIVAHRGAPASTAKAHRPQTSQAERTDVVG